MLHSLLPRSFACFLFCIAAFSGLFCSSLYGTFLVFGCGNGLDRYLYYLALPLFSRFGQCSCTLLCVDRIGYCVCMATALERSGIETAFLWRVLTSEREEMNLMFVFCLELSRSTFNEMKINKHQWEYMYSMYLRRPCMCAALGIGVG